MYLNLIVFLSLFLSLFSCSIENDEQQKIRSQYELYRKYYNNKMDDSLLNLIHEKTFELVERDSIQIRPNTIIGEIELPDMRMAEIDQISEIINEGGESYAIVRHRCKMIQDHSKYKNKGMGLAIGIQIDEMEKRKGTDSVVWNEKTWVLEYQVKMHLLAMKNDKGIWKFTYEFWKKGPIVPEKIKKRLMKSLKPEN